MIKRPSSFVQSLCLALVLGLGAGVVTPSSASAKGYVVDGKSSKTQTPDATHFKAYLAGLKEYEKAGKLDRVAILKSLREHAKAIKGELETLLTDLKANKEVEAFERYALEKAKAQGMEKELKAAGGASVVLADASNALDKDLKELVDDGTAPKTDFIAEPERIGQTACVFFFWVATVGYADGFAYHACLKK